MLKQPPYAVGYITAPATERDRRHYKQLRLSGLLTEPQFFGSNYEREAHFTEDEWKARLNAPGKATFKATVRECPSNRSTEMAILGEEEERWVGMLTVLGPSFLKEVYDDEELSHFSNRILYTIVGVWVEPEFRRKGMAGGLMQAASSWAYGDTEHGRGDAPKTVVLKVHRGNEPARKVYLRSGFQDLNHSTANGSADDEVWMVKHL